MDQTQYAMQTSEFVRAVGTLRTARTVLWVLVVASVVLQLASFAMIDFAGVMGESITPREAQDVAAGIDADRPLRQAAPPATQQVASRAADFQRNLAASHAASTSAAAWTEVFNWLLPATKFLALVASLLLALAMLLAVQVAIVARRPGLAQAVSAFFWSLVLVAMLVPWQQILGGGFASGAMYNLSEWQRWASGNHEMLDKVLYYARFMAYPLLALLVAIMVQVKFARGSRAMLGIQSRPAIPTQAPATPPPTA